MTIPPISLGLIKGAEWLKALHAEMFSFGQSHGYMNKNAEHTSVHALAGRLQAGPSGNLELTVPSSLIKGVFDALDEPGAEFVVRNNRTECAIKVMTKEEVDKLGGTSHITERGHSYHYTLGPIVELPATGDYDKLWAISIKSDDLEDIRKSYGLETSPQLGFYIPVGCKKKRVTDDNEVSKLAGVFYHSTLKDRVDSILEKGLDPSFAGTGADAGVPTNSPGYERLIYLTKKPTIQSYGPASFEVNLPDDFPVRPLYLQQLLAGNHVTSKPIPPEYIKLRGAKNSVSKLAESTKEADAAITPSNFKDYSKPSAPAPPTAYNRGSYPTSQPGPNYERGDSARGGWSNIPGWLEKNRPLPEEAPLSGASSDLAMLTPAGRIMSGIKGLASTPAAAKAISTASGSTGGASASNLWKALNLKGLVKNPYAKYGVPAAGTAYATGPGVIESAKSIPSALDSVNPYPKWMRNLPNIKEAPFSVTTGDRSTIGQIGSFGVDVAKATAGHAAYNGLNSFSRSSKRPANPLAYLPSAQASTAISKTVADKALPSLSQYAESPDLANMYRSNISKRLGIQNGEIAGKISVNAALPSFKLNSLSPYVSQGAKDVINTLQTPSPINVSPNPQFLKEVVNKYTPNVGEAAYDAMFKAPNAATQSSNFYNRLNEIGSSPNNYTDLGRKFTTPPVQTGEPPLRKFMSTGARVLGNSISDNLIPPRAAGQKPATMFPQISAYTDKLPWK